MLDMLRYLTAADQARLQTMAERRSFTADSVILPEGQRSPGIFVIERGEARVEVTFRGGKVAVATMYPGEWFGEMSYLEEADASATVTADTELVVALLPAASLDDWLAEDEHTAIRFYKSVISALSSRLKQRTGTMVPFYGGS